MREKWQRTGFLIGEKNIEKLRNIHISIFGLGAVGSFALEYLLRCGAENLTLIDFDKVSISNFNRLLFADAENLGKLKVEAATLRSQKINENARIRPFSMFIGNENIADFFKKEKFDIIIDAIDSLNPKIALLEAALRSDETVFSSMGAGGRWNPAEVKSGDLWQTKNCQLAAKIRRGLRKRGVEKPLPVVYSTELAAKPLSSERETEAEQAAYFERGRRRSLQPSIVFIPAVFAAFLAKMAIDFVVSTDASDYY